MTCMGRLAHVKQSLPRLLQEPLIDGVQNQVVFVDYYCPDGSGDWVESQFGDRVHVVKLADEAPLERGQMPIFNKPIAQNTGAVEALHAGAQYLVFLDADTLVTPELLAFVFHYASMERFLIFEPSLEFRDLTGFLVVHRRHFVKVNGFDSEFRGWGAEDLELRVKLFLRGKTPLNEPPRAILKHPDLYGLHWSEIPPELASSINHGDDLRVNHYLEKDKDESHGVNFNLLCSNIYSWLGTHPVDLQDTPLGPYIRRLLGMELVVNPRALE